MFSDAIIQKDVQKQRESEQKIEMAKTSFDANIESALSLNYDRMTIFNSILKV